MKMVQVLFAVTATFIFAAICAYCCVVSGDRADKCMPTVNSPSNPPTSPDVVPAEFSSVRNDGEYDPAPPCKGQYKLDEAQMNDLLANFLGDKVTIEKVGSELRVVSKNNPESPYIIGKLDDRIVQPTSLGDLVAVPSRDPKYPGIWVSMDDGKYDNALVLVEACDHDADSEVKPGETAIVTRVFKNLNDDEWTHRIQHS